MIRVIDYTIRHIASTNRQRRIPKRTVVQYRALLADALQHYYFTDTTLPVTNLPVNTFSS